MTETTRPAKSIFVLAGAALLAAIAWFALPARNPAPPRSAEAPTPPSEVEPTRSLPVAQLRRTDRHGRTNAAHEGEGPVTAEQARARQEERLRQLEAEFVAEPVSPGWAASTEKMIDASFSDETLANQGATAPLAHDVLCRMFTCRVEVTYADQVEADIGMQFMLGNVAASLPRARHVQISQPGGQVRWVAYLGTGGTHR